MSQLAVEGTYNIRDLGGLLTSDGQSIKHRTLLRSGNLDKLPESSQQALIDYGVKTVIDLRDEWETEFYPNVFENSDLVSYHKLPLIGEALSNDADWQRDSGDYVELHDLYINYIDRCQAQIGAIISTIAERETAILIHCYAGKDRTGIIVALILASLGVSEKTIAEDYALSYGNIQHLVQEWRQYAIENGRDLEQVERDASSSPRTIVEVIRHINKKYGSVDDYLKECGISIAKLQNLKNKAIT